MENTDITQKPNKTKERLVTGIQFRPVSKVYTFVTDDQTLSHGEMVVVESENTTAVGTVAIPPYTEKEGELSPNPKKVLRRARKEEIEEELKKRERAFEYFIMCRDKIREKNLSMKLTDVQIEEGGKKIAFVFFAEQRVDFRSLVKELAQTLHARIEMRQIGARDETKYKGCLSTCGLVTCCSGHLRDFQSISISMAKHQGLAPNPVKLTGMCGKLKCCLAYEEDVYNEYRRDLPKFGAPVESPKGAGKVVGHNVLKHECTVRLFGGGETRCACSSCRVLTPAEKDKALEAARQADEANEERSRRFASRRGGNKNEAGSRRHEAGKKKSETR